MTSSPCISEQDDYEAFLGCIEDALDLPNQPGRQKAPLVFGTKSSPLNYSDMCLIEI